MARYQKLLKLPKVGDLNLIGEVREMTEKDVK
jgi:hypothetical protein